MADLGYWGSTAFGAALVTGVRLIWGFIERRTQRADDATDETIVELREALAVSRANEVRLQHSVDRLGKRYDDLAALRERELTQAAGVAYRIKQDSKLPDELAEDMPTAVRDRTELLASKASLPPKAPPPRPPTKPVIVRETYAPNARPTDPAPSGYDPKRR